MATGSVLGQRVGGGKSPVVLRNDVTFYDYDGTVVAAYTIAEAQSLTTLPDAPVHERLTFQGWSHELSQVNALTRPMNIGATYITTDGKTHLIADIFSGAEMVLNFTVTQPFEGEAEVDWGDGSAIEMVSVEEDGGKSLSHIFNETERYDISLYAPVGCEIMLGANGKALMDGNEEDRLRIVEIGERTGLAEYAFYYSMLLNAILFPPHISSFGFMNTFERCGVSFIIYPQIVDETGEGPFWNSNIIEMVIRSGSQLGPAAFHGAPLFRLMLPDDIGPIIPEYAFVQLYCLSEATIPASVTGIEEGAFASCDRMKEYRFLPTSPPTLGDMAFYGIPDDCVIKVPVASLSAYQNDETWIREGLVSHLQGV